MKIKELLVVVTLIFALILSVSYYYLYHEDKNAVDIVAINHVVKTVEETFAVQKESIKRTGKVETLNYELILREDNNYQEKINEAVENRLILLDLSTEDEIMGKIIFTDFDSVQRQMKNRLLLLLFLVIGAVWAIMVMVILRLYTQIIKPFQSMQNFAQKVAQGKLDIPLDMQKNNYFGAFTESFDLMRDELKRARQAEYEANISKKELVAQVSHDIKTPVSTIKAICELIQAKLNQTLGGTGKEGSRDDEVLELLDFSSDKIQIVYHKADMIDKLISNMFHATLEELEMLKIEPKETDSSVIGNMLEEMNHYEKIYLKNKLPKCLILCDSLRLSQVLDNVISNSYKYANTDIHVWFFIDKNNKLLNIKIKDFGLGVKEEELLLICQKYYRGTNDSIKNTSGSGLGMYLTRLFIEGMDGTLHYYNEDGFAVEIGIRIV